MESRLRKLLPHKRQKARSSDANAELDLHSIPYTTASPQGRLPVFIYQALGKSAGAKRRTSDLHPRPLPSFSYEEAAPGQPPELGVRPHRGNGPVKLQTSRRLSSGELLVTQQDYDRTLEEIRDGEYIVGGKERRTSRTSSQPKSPTEPSHLKVISTAPSSPRDQGGFPSPIWQPPSMLSDSALVTSPASAPAAFSPRERSYSSQGFQYPHHSQSYHMSSNGLGTSQSSHQFYPRHMASTTSLLEPHEEQNPTIQALWKAEYSRLVSIYGQAGVDRNIVELNRDHPDAPVPDHQFPNRDMSYSPSFLAPHQPTHAPLSPSMMRSGFGLRPNASTMNLDLAYRDDGSDGSSYARYSQLSSSGASSSITGRTSMAEDSTVTRDDIRKIVDDMRTNYLHAIEAHTPPLQPSSDFSLRKPPSTKQTPSLVSYASMDGSLRSASRQSTARTKSWQSTATYVTTPRTSVSSPTLKSMRTSSATSRRTSGHPAAGIATLPAIQASPAKSAKSNRKKKQDDVGLKRADSTTLGVMARQLTIVDDRNSTGSSNLTYKSSPTFYNSSGSDSDSRATSPPSSPRLSPVKPLSVQHTPEKHKPIARHQSPLAKQPWQIDVDRIPDDQDLDLALDIDDFESLCDGLFNSVASSDRQTGVFNTWGDTDRARGTSLDHGAVASGRSAELRTSKLAPEQMGLGLTGLPAMI